MAVASNGYVALSWLPYRGATGYVVRCAAAGEASYSVLGSTAATVLSVKYRHLHLTRR